MTDRKKPGVAFWATVVLVGVLLYVASFGPACWITSRTRLGEDLLPTLYLPVILAWDLDSPYDGLNNHPLHEFLWWFTRVGADGDWRWFGTGADSFWKKAIP